MDFNNNIGRLEVITGSMFSGKSEELIRRLRRAEYAKQKIVVFKHSIDNRYGEKGIFSHGRESFEAYPVNTVEQMEEIMDKNIDTDVIGIDEVQFFGEKIVNFCKKYVEYGKRVIIAGLDMSFRAEPYHPMPELMSISDQTDKLQAICTICGKPAYASQRIINGEPAYYEDPLVMVGASENYEARCRRHHIVRYKEEKGKIYFIIGTEPDVGKKKVEDIYSSSLGGDVKIVNMVLKGNIEETGLNHEESGAALLELREKIEKSIKENDYVLVRVVGGILLNIHGNYNVLDFICEYRKKSEIIITSKNKKGTINQLMLMMNLLKKSDLNIKEIIYQNNGEEKENHEIIERVKDISKINYRIIE